MKLNDRLNSIRGIQHVDTLPPQEFAVAADRKSVV